MKHTKECRNLQYKTLVFDEFFTSDDIDTCATAKICPVCASVHRINETLLTPTEGGCACGVKGCMNEVEYTISFPKNSEEYIFGGAVDPNDIAFVFNRDITIQVLTERQNQGMYDGLPEQCIDFDTLSDAELLHYFNYEITQADKIAIYNGTYFNQA